MVSHRERSPGALAHGPAKSSDIQRVRRDLGAAELKAARDLSAKARRHRRDGSRLVHDQRGR
ncbi:MAG: hypothetical protein QOH72_5170 [Solirubrobacteraceae bacterium]|jgi:hypothetical protein|nr:hypothetical protein [Solirubrobacteraceae bacterium]